LKPLSEIDVEALVSAICDWMETHRKSAGATGFVVGVSGGVDSALVAALCKRTGAPTTALIMPCKSQPEDREIAERFLHEAKIEHRVVILDSVFDAQVQALIEGGVFRGMPDARAVAMANVKPRLRMVTLYAFANENKRLVAGTGNRSEDALGYFTKYGDGGVDILPIADLVKREVRLLARHLGIPKEIVDRIPTAGLWLGQTDEGEMGVTYDQIESYLREFDEILEGWHGGSARDVHETLGKRSTDYRRISEMCLAAAHKTSYPPVFPAREMLRM
jgi:NAD+ synthase